MNTEHSSSEAGKSDIFQITWRFFASVRLTIFILILLAATSVVGTLIPQNESPMMYFREYGAFLFRLFSVLGLFDMYHSWWFQMLVLMLAFNIVVCSIERLSRTWKIIFPKSVRFSPKTFGKNVPRASFSVPGFTKTGERAVEARLKRQFGRFAVESPEPGLFRAYGEKGRWTRLGPYVVHASVLLLLAGALTGSMLGFEGFVNIPENSAVDHIRLRRTGRVMPLDFTVRLDKAETTYYENNTPKEYLAVLTVLEQGNPVLTQDVMVNHPMTYKGVRFYLSSIGDVPGDAFTLAFESQASKMIYTLPVKIGKTVDMPENLGKFHLTDMKMEGNFQGHAIGQTVEGEIIRNGEKPIQVLIPLKFPTFDRMRRGKVVVSVADFEKKYYTGLQVNNDPGVVLVYAGFLLMIAGCLITFFIPHQRVMVEVHSQKTGRGRVTVASAAGAGRLGMEKRAQVLADQLAGDLKARP